MVSPSARRLHVPARPRPCPLPTLLGQGGAYLADQAIQVGLGPAHGHHLRTRRVQRLDRAAPNACGELGSVRARLPGGPLGPPLPVPGRRLGPTFARPGDERPAPRKPQLHEAWARSGRCVRPTECQGSAVRRGPREARGGTRRPNRRRCPGGGGDMEIAASPPGRLAGRSGRGRAEPAGSPLDPRRFSSSQVATLKPGVKMVPRVPLAFFPCQGDYYKKADVQANTSKSVAKRDTENSVPTRFALFLKRTVRQKESQAPLPPAPRPGRRSRRLPCGAGGQSLDNPVSLKKRPRPAKVR